MYSTVFESNLCELKTEPSHNAENSIHDKQIRKYHNWDAGRVLSLKSQELPTSNTWEEKSGFFFCSYWFEWIPVKRFAFQKNALFSVAGKRTVAFIPKPLVLN